MPQVSTGCFTCRKRKIRCDERRPGCEKCAIHRVQCGGYRFPAKDTRGRSPKRGMSSDGPDLQFEFEDLTGETAIKAQQIYARKKMKLLRPASECNEKALLQRSSGFPPITVNINYDLHSASLERARLYSTFISTYLPPGIRNPHFHFMYLIISLPNPPPALSHALDALSLVQLGNAHNSTPLLGYSVHAYGRALGMLLQTLATRPQSATHDDYVLATNAVLATCEYFEHIARAGGGGWIKHMEGSMQLIKARGPQSVLDSELATELYLHIRHAVLGHALIARKACFMGDEEWMCMGLQLPHWAASTLFYDTAMRIPELLERTDALAESDDDENVSEYLSKVQDLLDQAKALESELIVWLSAFQASVEEEGQKHLYRLAPIEEFPTFTRLVSSRAVDKAFIFEDFTQAYIMAVYWSCMHTLKTTIQSLLTSRQQADLEWPPSPEEVVPEDEMMALTMKICRCLPFFIEPVSSSLGQVSVFLPLRITAIYAISNGHWPLARWVSEIRHNGLSKGMGPPDVQTRANAALNSATLKTAMVNGIDMKRMVPQPTSTASNVQVVEIPDR